jgi:heme/copper-type cytochrome/quinol oxidase subunit 4
MIELKKEKNQNIPRKDQNSGSFTERKILLLFLLVLITSIAGYFATNSEWLNYTFAHLGGSAIVGLLGCCAGIVAMKKGYGFWKAFLIGFFLPIILGFVAVFLIQPMSCGGTVSLAAAVFILIIYSFVKRRMVTSLI